ncbi:AAA family ATPase [Arcobacter sp.]|uniref:AAA family ATPase n=1 Tax=Arcobacter sp. TaxID=1872629 RepID=UPI003C73B7A5
MKIIFIKDKDKDKDERSENRIELYPDTPWNSKGHPWDDFGYRTTFLSTLFFNGKEYELPNTKILIDNYTSTHDYFKKIIKESEKNYIKFPLDDNYVSLATDIEFYEILNSVIENHENIKNILNTLKDASYIKYNNLFPDLLFLIQSEGFKKSLLRDMTSKKALIEGWLVIENIVEEKNEKFNISFSLSNYENNHNVEINFKKSIFPHNINVLIGSNGTGKSQTLSATINQLLGLEKVDNSTISFNQIVTIAYSPFEDFLVSLEGKDINIKSVYKYFGFRNQEGEFNIKNPFIDSVKNIISMVNEDFEKNFLKNRINKFNSFITVIGKAISFDYIGFRISDETANNYEDDAFFNNKITEDGYYIVVDDEEFHSDLESEILDIIEEEGIVFFKDDEKVFLSSGQQVFAQLISSIVSSIRNDTLLLIDEPELYLHPNLEVELITLLKELLFVYKSYAIIASHSSIIAREVAKDYITVLKRIEGKRINVSRPPFETIGANLEKINAYVFFGKDVDKSYTKWLQELVNKEGSKEGVIKKYKKKLNEESLILIQGMIPDAD